MYSRVQIEKFQEENGCTLPSIVSIPGHESLLLGRLVAMTGPRFLRTVQQQPSSILSVFGPEEQAAARTMLAIIGGSAPHKLSMAELEKLLEVCKFSLAHSLVCGLVDLLKPWLHTDIDHV